MSRIGTSFISGVIGGIGLCIVTYFLLKLTDFFWDAFSMAVFFYFSFPAGAGLGYAEGASCFLRKRQRFREAGWAHIGWGSLVAFYLWSWLRFIGFDYAWEYLIEWSIILGIPILLTVRTLVLGIRLLRSHK